MIKNMEQQAKNNIKTKKSHTFCDNLILIVIKVSNICAMDLGIATSGIHFG